MATAVEVPITGSVLAWAVQESGFPDDEIARRADVPVATLRGWMAGDGRPTKTQFHKLVEAVKRPSAIFFLTEAPVEAGLPTRFRQAPGGHTLGPPAIREVRKARRLQRVLSWLIERNHSEPALDVPYISWQEVDATEAGQDARRALGLSLVQQMQWRDQADAYRQWRQIYEEMGILLWSLQLGKSEIRGFSAWDDWAPVVAVNTAYVESARIFTLAHEFAHLVSRTDSVCQDWINPEHDGGQRLERWCEEFAAAFLLPPDTLKSLLAYQFSIDADNPVTDFESTWRLSRRFKVSARAMAISLIDLGLAPSHLYDIVEEAADRVDRRPQRDDGGGGGQRAYEARVSQYGARSAKLLVEAGSVGELGERDVADYLSLGLSGLEDLARYLRTQPSGPS